MCYQGGIEEHTLSGDGEELISGGKTGTYHGGTETLSRSGIRGGIIRGD